MSMRHVYSKDLTIYNHDDTLQTLNLECLLVLTATENL